MTFNFHIAAQNDTEAKHAYICMNTIREFHPDAAIFFCNLGISDTLYPIFEQLGITAVPQIYCPHWMLNTERRIVTSPLLGMQNVIRTAMVPRHGSLVCLPAGSMLMGPIPYDVMGDADIVVQDAGTIANFYLPHRMVEAADILDIQLDAPERLPLFNAGAYILYPARGTNLISNWEKYTQVLLESKIIAPAYCMTAGFSLAVHTSGLRYSIKPVYQQNNPKWPVIVYGHAQIKIFAIPDAAERYSAYHKMYAEATKDVIPVPPPTAAAPPRRRRHRGRMRVLKKVRKRGKTVVIVVRK